VINDAINRINDALLAHIRRKSGKATGLIVVDGDGVRLMDGDKARWSIAWRDVVRITALWNPGFVGETLLATIEATGRSQFLAEEQEGWAEFAASLPAHLPAALPFELWSLRLVAGGDEANVAVYERG
jgi:hypothetical protein